MRLAGSNDHDSGDASRLFAVLGRFSSAKFHEPSARDARRRIVDFLDTHLTV